MSSYTANQKRFIPTPPEKGTFPLDHEGVCRNEMLKYMVCLQKNDRNYSFCSSESKQYLDCRMKNNLMAKEEWSRLGFNDAVDK